ncbi:MAG: lysine exporter LysO family protein [Firmicutes bacterium]|nr:lysine exporter LysO family protein [Bacillota bacterium]
MTLYIPFICIALGCIINWKGLPEKALSIINFIMNSALMLLMAVVGLNVGTSREVMDNLGRIGLNCIIMCLGSVFCAVLLTVLLEKTILPLEEIRLKLMKEKGLDLKTVPENRGVDPLMIAMPVSIALGLILGLFVVPDITEETLDILLNISLILLYTGAGVSLATNKIAFLYIKKLGLRILLLPLAIFVGGLISGLIMSKILGVDLCWSVTASSTMGYYSLPGAFMTEAYGVEAGIYGFMVNIFRDICTVTFMPVLRKISKGSPIASGAGGCMDSMFIPVTRAVGPELGIAGLIVGTIITIFVPFWLPLSQMILG